MTTRQTTEYCLYLFLYRDVRNIFALYIQIKEEVAKLLELKKQVDDGKSSGQFVLKCPKVCFDLSS